MSRTGPRVLLIDDDALVRRGVRRAVTGMGFEVLEAEDGETGLEILAAEQIDVALVDMRMPGISGLEVLGRARALGVDTECIVLTGHGDIETATRCLEAGASDYFEKPVQDWPRFQQVLRRAAAFAELRREADQIRADPAASLLTGNSPQLVAVREQIEMLAPSTALVLIQGESGTGKELVARALHRRSDRSGKFVGVNCGGLPEALLENELFGSVRGGHSAAFHDHDGYFAQADGGTLLLDEIGDMPVALQVKLLRVLEQGEFQPLGAERPRNLTARVVAATHRDLKAEVEAGRFRADLRYRLDVAQIRVPPLREREGDVAVLTYRFIHEFDQVESRDVQRVAPDALRALEAYGWPGNVRELRNVIRRAVLHSRGTELTLDLLNDSVRAADAGPATHGEDAAAFDFLMDLDYGEAKDRAIALFAKAYLTEHLRRADGVISRAAASTGMQRPNFRRLMTRYDIEPEG